MGGGTTLPSHTPRNPPKPRLESVVNLRVITHNIRYATASPFKGEELWEVRKPKLCAQLLYHIRPSLVSSIIFLQEVLYDQFKDIHRSLFEHSCNYWTGLGRGRDDGKRGGEFSPIIFNMYVWEIVDESNETIWLNETGEVGKKGWDAASVRIVTTVVLQHCASGKRVLLMNTHLDDQGSISRTESAKILVKECQARRKKFDVDAAVLGGDLNSETNGDAYPVIANFEESRVVDVRILATGEDVYGEENTFTGFDGHGDGENLKRIDFLFMGTKKENDSGVPAYAVLPNRFEDGVYLSDHRAVVADFII